MPLAPDRPNILPWAPKQPIDHRRLNELQAAVVTDVKAGPGLLASRKANSVTISMATQPKTPPGVTVVTILGTGTPIPGGLYAASYGPLTATGTDGKLDTASVATSLSTLIAGGTGTSCYFIHLPEIGLTTHDLTDADNEAARLALGVFTGITASDGKPVLAGIALPYGDCPT